MTNVLRDEPYEGTQSIVSEIIYRSSGVVMFDEDAEPWTRRKRTRISARFDRTHWEPELFHPFAETRSTHAPHHVAITPFNSEAFGNPKGASGVVARNPRPKAKPKLAPSDRRLASAPGFQHRYTRAHVEAVPTHGKYRMLAAIEYGEHGGIKVRAICEGGFCAGKVRVFDPSAWLDMTEAQCCPRCAARQKRQGLYDQMVRDVNTKHGAYRFLRFETRGNDTDHFVRRVVGECTGAVCGGRERAFAYAAWQDGKEGRGGCFQCVKVDYKRGAVTPLTKLDDTAEEMREMEAAS